VWIDLPDKHGLMFPRSETAWTFQELDNQRRTRFSLVVHLDPTSLALVARGSKKLYQIQPSQRWEIKHPGLYVSVRHGRMSRYMVTGTTFDSTNRCLTSPRLRIQVTIQRETERSSLPTN
jgi:hypothetical protein